jgi:hypothetical protein
MTALEVLAALKMQAFLPGSVAAFRRDVPSSADTAAADAESQRRIDRLWSTLGAGGVDWFRSRYESRGASSVAFTSAEEMLLVLSGPPEKRALPEGLSCTLRG